MTLRCPICRQVVRQRVDELLANYALQDVIDNSLQSRKWLCQACCEDRQLQQATARCQECDESLCDSCRAKHAGGQHKLTLLVKRKCHHHQQQDLELYCSSCQMNICVLCYSEAHRSHDCDATSKVAEKLTNDLKNVIERLCFLESRLTTVQPLVETQKKKYNHHRLNLEKCVDRRVPLLREATEALQLDSWVTKKQKDINEILERYNNGMSTDHKQARALMQDIDFLINVFLRQLNSHATRLQEVLTKTETLKIKATGISLLSSAYDVVDNKATIIDLEEEVQAFLQDRTIKEVFAIQKSSDLLSSGKVISKRFVT